MIWYSNRDAGRIKNENGRMVKLFYIYTKIAMTVSA